MASAKLPISTVNGAEVFTLRRGSGRPRAQADDIALLPFLLRAVSIINPPEEPAAYPNGLPKMKDAEKDHPLWGGIWERMNPACLSVARQARCADYAEGIVRRLFEKDWKLQPKNLEHHLHDAAKRISNLLRLSGEAEKAVCRMAGNLWPDLAGQWTPGRHRQVLLAVAGEAARWDAEDYVERPPGMSKPDWLEAHRGRAVAGEGGRGERGPESRSERVLAQNIKRAVQRRWPDLQHLLEPAREAAARSGAAWHGEL